MEKLSNTQGITRINMNPIAYTKCKIGQDWYKNEIEIVFVPDKSYPDYMEINEYIMREIDGKELNIEDVVNMIYEKIKEEYEPKSLRVTNYINNCKTHFDVVVEKE